jgi:hypothetical protein
MPIVWDWTYFLFLFLFFKRRRDNDKIGEEGKKEKEIGKKKFNNSGTGIFVLLIDILQEKNK